MNSPLSIIISREYLERVKRKSFIITTLLVPLLMIICMVAPALFMLLGDDEQRNIAVIDDTAQIAQLLRDTDDIRFTTLDNGNLDAARADDDYDAILAIGARAIDNPEGAITLYTRGAASMNTDTEVTSQLNRAIEDIRLRAYNIDNIRQILKEVEADVTLSTVRIDTSEDTETSSILSYFLGLIMDMLLYMFILIYGQIVMNSIIEEKNNRVLEIVVSSVKPMILMMGKIIGVGLVAITQILIWAVIAGAASGWLLPFLSSSTDVSSEPAVAAAIQQLSDTGYVASLFVYMILFFVGGYFFYSSIYAAIGSAVDNIQDAGQLSSVATIPVVIGIIASMSIIQNPNTALAFWLSVIPFTSPMAMMSRLPFGVPVWETILSLTLLYASFIFMIWLCGKIYRVGIFMYGKKPTFVELMRWARYK
ncbi:MAG: ABC transporter permease [Muribaculaceae bacterium]|uniref:ABC transporter permease n=1 Tax=uncultured Duncaniella sp. TaxID=2768039 RepID=UPI00263B2CAE|nr:ABC transporter permease [uncultured Duncaniella sp.]